MSTLDGRQAVAHASDNPGWALATRVRVRCSGLRIRGLLDGQTGAYKRTVMVAGAMTTLVVSGALAGTPAHSGQAPEAPVASTKTGTDARPGEVLVGPARRQSVTLRDVQGRIVATVVVREDRGSTVSLPPGTYTMRTSADDTPQTVVIRGGQLARVILPGAREASLAPPERSAPGVFHPKRLVPAEPVEPAPKRWTRWGAPLLSALIPGLGQAVNRQGGKAAAVLAGSVGLTAGSIALWRTGDPRQGATLGDEGEGVAVEVTRLGALSLLSLGAGLLYLGQIMDAHARATRKQIRPQRDHAVNVELGRYTAVGMRPAQPSQTLYTDWTLSVMGQILPRIQGGLSDLTVKVRTGSRRKLTFQAGLRASYRFYDRRRIWLGIGGGVLFQGTSTERPALSVDPEDDEPEVERRFGIAPYLQFDARWFLLDRWSLNLAPRVSIPLAHRDYRQGKIPRYAVTFELGGSVGVYF